MHYLHKSSLHAAFCPALRPKLAGISDATTLGELREKILGVVLADHPPLPTAPFVPPRLSKGDEGAVSDQHIFAEAVRLGEDVAVGINGMQTCDVLSRAPRKLVSHGSSGAHPLTLLAAYAALDAVFGQPANLKKGAKESAK